MGRPPCCDEVGVKKGPWTPEEDIMLVSYVQEHGPSNWGAVPSITGLRRCSKSCRLRWANYLRPGIKRGSFTDDEEKMIIQLQSLLGNKWAAIASYLPERTDNDIKNYWNTHLKKKLKKLQEASHDDQSQVIKSPTSCSMSRGQWEKKLHADIDNAKQALHEALSLEKKATHLHKLNSPNGYCSNIQTSAYASSIGNISRLLKGWLRDSPNTDQANSSTTKSSLSSEGLSESFHFGSGLSSSDLSQSGSPESKPDLGIAHDQVPLSMLENWLFDEVKEEDLSNFSFDENVELF